MELELKICSMDQTEESFMQREGRALLCIGVTVASQVFLVVLLYFLSNI